MNYKVCWVGIIEGYEILKTTDCVNDYDVFRTFREAKTCAVEKAKSDVEGTKRGLQVTKSITKGEVSEE